MEEVIVDIMDTINILPSNINYRIIINYSVNVDNICILSVKDTKYFINDNYQPLNMTIETKEFIYDYYEL